MADTMRPAAIVFDRVSFRFVSAGVDIVVLDDVDVSVDKGSFVTVLGASGSGKSTFLRLVGDLVTPSSGTIQVFSTTPAEARRRRALGFMFQDPALLPWRTALQNVELPLQVGNPPRPLGGPTPIELLDAMELAHRRSAYPAELSGGERQRVALARALVGSPELLLLDEPFAALDEIARSSLNDLLQRLWRQTGCTVLYVTHDVREAALLGQRIIVLGNKGRAHIMDVDRIERTLDRFEPDELEGVLVRLRQKLLDAGPT